MHLGDYMPTSRFGLGLTITPEMNQGVDTSDESWWEKIIDIGGGIVKQLPTFRLPTVPTYPTYDPNYPDFCDPGMNPNSPACRAQGYPDTSRIPLVPQSSTMTSMLPFVGIGLAVLLLSRSSRKRGR